MPVPTAIENELSGSDTKARNEVGGAFKNSHDESEISVGKGKDRLVERKKQNGQNGTKVVGSSCD